MLYSLLWRTRPMLVQRETHRTTNSPQSPHRNRKGDCNRKLTFRCLQEFLEAKQQNAEQESLVLTAQLSVAADFTGEPGVLWSGSWLLWQCWELSDLIFGDQVVSVFFVCVMASGDSVWTPIHIKRPQYLPSRQKCDEISCRCQGDNAPGVLLCKGSVQVWSHIASRTRGHLNICPLMHLFLVW